MFGSGLKLRQKGILIVSVPLLLEILFIGMLMYMLQNTQHDLQQQIRARAIISQATKISDTFNTAAQNASSYLLTNGHVLFADASERNLAELPPQMEQLKKLLAGPRETEVFTKLQAEADRGLNAIRGAKSMGASKRTDIEQMRANDLSQEIRSIGTKFREYAQDLTSEAREIDLASPEKLSNSQQNLNIVLIAGLVANIVVALLVASVMSQGITSRLRVLTDNSLRLATGQPLNPLIAGKDEISDLDRVFHAMATAIEEAARRERAIIDHVVDVICTIDKNGKFMQVSKSAQTAWGYDSSDLIGQRYVSIVEPTYVESTLKAFSEAEKTNMPVFVYDNRIKRKDGTTVDLSWSCCWSEADKSAFCIAHDVTERKRLEQLRKDFVAMVSHDLRTPLSSLRMFLEMITGGLFANKQEKMIPTAQSMEAEVTRLITMVNNLLELEKMESGVIECLHSTFNIKRMFERSNDAVAQISERSRVAIKIDCDDDTTMSADEDKLIQVIVNLLSNAIKFSPANSTVTLQALSNNGWHEIRVSDEGRGIPASHIDKVFDRFEQVEIADSRVKGGTGLGLAISKAIVAAHGGEIGVTSEEGKGSTFWFRIPNGLRNSDKAS